MASGRAVSRNTLLVGGASFFADMATEMLTPILPIFLTQALNANGSVVGLIDGIGHLREIMRKKLGSKTELKVIAKPSAWGLRRLAFGSDIDLTSGLIDAVEARALWSRFGL